MRNESLPNKRKSITTVVTSIPTPLSVILPWTPKNLKHNLHTCVNTPIKHCPLARSLTRKICMTLADEAARHTYIIKEILNQDMNRKKNNEQCTKRGW